MKRLLNNHRTPPGGWRYVDPDTNFVFDRGYRSLEELAAHVRLYRKQNKLSAIKKVSAVIEDWLCAQPDVGQYCHECGAAKDKTLLSPPPVEEEPAPEEPRTLRQYLQGAMAYIETVVAGDEGLVSQEVAEKRAAICSTCPHNRPTRGHSALGEYTDRKVQELVGNRRTSKDDKLWTCRCCTCPLRSKVHFAQNIVQENLSDKEKAKMPGRCWQINPVE